MKILALLIVTLVPVLASADPIEHPSDTSAKIAGKTTEVCITDAVGGTTVPATAFAYRKAIEVQNLGPNAIFCTVDGTAPLSTGAHGRKVDAGGSWSLDLGPKIVMKCIAATAAQVTPACSMVTEVR